MFKKTIIFTVTIALVMTLVSSMVLASDTTLAFTPAPSLTPTPTPELQWDFWLTINSSNAAQGLIRVNGGNATDSIKFWFHNTNPWPKGGLTIEALPKNGFQFDGWYEPWYEYDRLVTTENPYIYKGNHEYLIAKFIAAEITEPTPPPEILWNHWLSISSSNAAQGFIRVNSGDVTESIKYWFNNTNPWPKGGLTVEALPIYNFQFNGWYENNKLVTIENPYTFMEKHVNLVAKFSAVEATNVIGVKTLKEVYIVKGMTIKLPGAVQPYNAADKSMTWKTANKKVATVDKNGKVKGVKTGIVEIYITSKDGKKTAKCTVHVVEKAVELKNLEKLKNVKLTAGKTMQVKPVLKPANATGIVPKFETSNAEIAFIDAAGVFTALEPGKTTITVTASKLTREFVLTVEEAVKK